MRDLEKPEILFLMLEIDYFTLYSSDYPLHMPGNTNLLSDNLGLMIKNNLG